MWLLTHRFQKTAQELGQLHVWGTFDTSLDETGVGTLKLGDTWASNTSLISLVAIISIEVSKTPTENVLGCIVARYVNAAE